jgi:hypothetical protein
MHLRVVFDESFNPLLAMGHKHVSDTPGIHVKKFPRLYFSTIHANVKKIRYYDMREV